MNDVISDIFSQLHLHSRLYFYTDFRGDYGIEIPKEKRLVRFHYVQQGRCYIAIPEVGEYELKEGSLILIPNGAAQMIKAAPTSPIVSLHDVIQQQGIENDTLSFGEGEAETKLLCGYCQYDDSVDHPVVAKLPPAIIVDQDTLDESNRDLAFTLRLLAEEVATQRIGMRGVLNRLLEILFIQTFRLSMSNDDSESFIAALQDNKISHSLNLIHNQFELKWTTAQLAKQVGMSRARFSARFTHLVGMPPITYLTKWRLLKSRTMLRNKFSSIQNIAEKCGYDSAASFARTFKREFNLSPAAYRMGNQTGEPNDSA